MTAPHSTNPTTSIPVTDGDRVDFVEMDQKVSIPDEPQGKVDAVEANPNATAPVVGPQGPAPSHPDLVFRRYNGLTPYLNNPNGGEGVCAYVVDSGVDVTHPVRRPLDARFSHASRAARVNRTNLKAGIRRSSAHG